MIKYFKAAFLNRWNLLAVFAGAGVAVLSGQPEVVGALLLAGEVTYLSLLGGHPKFQAYVNAQSAKQNREVGEDRAHDALKKILRALPRPTIQRFEALRSQCLELRQIAAGMKSPTANDYNQTLDSFQVNGLDRLLWIFLRLLFTEYSLSRFLDATDDAAIEADIARLEVQLREVAEAAEQEQQQSATRLVDEGRQQKIRKTLEDHLQTSRDRLVNLRKAQDNLELVQLEIDRLENKIRSLAEVAVNRQEPDFISVQVDQVANSMLQTERTMNELQFATGLSEAEDQAPELLERGVVRVRQ